MVVWKITTIILIGLGFKEFCRFFQNLMHFQNNLQILISNYFFFCLFYFLLESFLDSFWVIIKGYLFIAFNLILFELDCYSAIYVFMDSRKGKKKKNLFDRNILHDRLNKNNIFLFPPKKTNQENVCIFCTEEITRYFG